jgi:hypothetical protein
MTLKSTTLCTLLYLTSLTTLANEISFISIANNYSGQLLTVDDYKGQYTYTYTAAHFADTHPNKQNFLITYSANGNIRIAHEKNNSCIRAYYDYIVDFDCDDSSLNDWEALPATQGSLQLRNLAREKCLSISGEIGNKWTSLILVECKSYGSPVSRHQLWDISPPRGPASISPRYHDEL